MNYLLDTCVISELIARTPHPAVVAWVDAQDAEKIYLSVITIGEIQKGIAKLPASQRKTSLQAWLQDDLLIRFRDHVLPLNTAVLLAWGDLVARLEQQGQPMPAIDSLIAATAKQRDLALVTRNVADFEHSGIEIVNPWENGVQ